MELCDYIIRFRFEINPFTKCRDKSNGTVDLRSRWCALLLTIPCDIKAEKQH